MVVRPYFVTTWEGERRLALGFDAKTAQHRLLYIIYHIKGGIEREALMQRMRCVEVYPYQVGNNFVFAEDCIEAGESSKPCDPWFALNDLPDTELADQCRLIWKKDFYKHCYLSYFVDPVYQRLRRKGPDRPKWKDPYSKSSRALMVAQLRLAMYLLFIPSQSLAHTNTLDAIKRRESEVDAAGRGRFRKLHEDNIGSRLVDYLLDTVGPGMEWYNKDVRRDVVKLCKSYGYNPDEMTWMQVAALWHEGVPGYRLACAEAEYSKYAKF